MPALMTLEGSRAPSLGDTTYTGIGPIDALLNSPIMLVLGVIGGVYLASARGQKQVAGLKKRYGKR